jgi:hypothetical protein
MSERQPPGADDCSVEQVADLLDEMCAGDELLAVEMLRILRLRAAVSQAANGRFTPATDELLPGAQARAELSTLDPARVLAGTRVWLDRNRGRIAATASARATAHWADKALA